MRIHALVRRIILELVRDKRTMALLIVAPLLILTLMNILFNSPSSAPKLGVNGIAALVQERFRENGIEVVALEDPSDSTLLAEDLDGVLSLDQGAYVLRLVNTDPVKSKALQMSIKQAFAISGQVPATAGSIAMPVPALSVQYVYGSGETSFFDILSPVLVGYFVFFFVFLIAGMGLLKERMTGTLERLMATPVRRFEVVAGYLVGYGIFALVQTVAVVIFAIQVLEMTMVGSVWHVILVNLVLALVALSLGILLSAFATSEFQMMQFIPLVIIPQIFFAGIFPVADMAPWLQILGKIMPIYYASDALKGIMYKGWGIAEISNDLIALGLFAFIFVILNTLALKKYRTL